MGHGPCKNIPDTSLGHYYVQQNLYVYLLKGYGVDVQDMYLLQLHPDQEGYVVHEVPKLPDVVAAIVEERLAENE